MTTMKVLVVDDDPTTCRLLETVLQMDDHETVSANTVEGGDIVSLLTREKPQILIMDIHLGSQDTLEYISAIRANAKWRHLPILMTSAIDLRQECLQAGASNFILKPFNWDEVTQMVTQIRSQLVS
jgi:DNA-binding response OmpR family regulator